MNISISEILVIFLIALLVIKPEQLPEVAASVGQVIRSILRFFAKMKEEVNHFIEPVKNEQKSEHQS